MSRPQSKDVENSSAGSGGLGARSDCDSEKYASDTDTKANIIDWDTADDATNPMNWPERRKWVVIALVSSFSFLVSMAITISAPGISQTLAEFHSTSQSLGSFLVSIFIIGYIFGPFVLTPLGESYGRSPITHVANVAFLIFTILCAVSVNIAMLAVFRFCMGIAGSVAMTLGGGFIADLMPPERRGAALSIWAVGPLLGPVVAPIIGGYLSMNKGWRWCFWLTAIMQAFLTTLAFAFLRETYGPRILELKAQRLRKETGNNALKSKFDSGETVQLKMRRALIRPTKMLLRSPIIGILALYVSVTYSYMYLLFTTFTDVFQGRYHFNTGAAGLAYLGLGLGFLIAQVALGIFSDWYLQQQKQLHGELRPEARLLPLTVAGLLVATGLIWYGWSVELHTHWIVPIVGTAFAGMGLLLVYMPIQMYLVDAFGIYAASAIATNTIVRSIFGALVPLAAPPLYKRLGFGWGNTLLAFIVLLFAPTAFLLLRYGERIRTSPRFQPNL